MLLNEEGGHPVEQEVSFLDVGVVGCDEANIGVSGDAVGIVVEVVGFEA